MPQGYPRGKLPGSVEGFCAIARDEHRHVAYGTWFLQQAVEEEGMAKRVRDRLSELLPLAAGVLAPKGKDPFGEWELLGSTSAGGQRVRLQRCRVVSR